MTKVFVTTAIILAIIIFVMRPDLRTFANVAPLIFGIVFIVFGIYATIRLKLEGIAGKVSQFELFIAIIVLIITIIVVLSRLGIVNIDFIK